MGTGDENYIGSAAETIEGLRLIKQALPGIQLTHLANPPSAIPVKLKYQYFSLNQSGAAWEAVGRAHNFAAYVPGDFPNPEMELLILMPQS